MEGGGGSTDDGGVAGQPRATKARGGGKKRSTRACDQCRKAKSRCDSPLDGRSCSNCRASGIECTTSGPTRKRGPPKGYLHAVETRLREVEALVGVILRAEDPKIKSFLQELSKDPFAKTILDRVDSSPFGPTGRENSNVPSTSEAPLSPRRRDSQSSMGKGVTPAWQDQVLSGIQSQSSSIRSTVLPQARVMDSPLPLSSRPAFGSTRPQESSSTGGLAIGNEQIYPHGSSRTRYDVDHVESEDERFSSREPQPEASSSLDASKSLSLSRASDPYPPQLPGPEVQKQLIEAYFACIHPTFPVLARSQFAKEYNERNSDHIKPSFEFLLMTVFAIASHIIEPDKPDRPQTPTPSYSLSQMRNRILDEAKTSTQLAYHQPDTNVCQSLLLLGLHEFGMGQTSHAWLFVGLAIRTAQELGLHRSNDKWQNSEGRNVFNEEEQSVRKRIWFCCVKADSYLSMYMCRPLSIHDCDYDARMDIEAESHDEDISTWSPFPVPSSAGFYTPVPGRVISCFNANITLCRLVGRILESLYSPNVTRRASEVIDLKQDLAEWLEKLPPSLQVNDHNTMFRAPAHFLGLHAEYRSALILMNRPFLRIGRSEETPQEESNAAWKECLTAAQHINDLTKAWKINFTLSHTATFLVFDIYHAGLIWIGASKFQLREERFAQNLEFCLDALREMAVTHASATQARQLLLGARQLRSGNEGGSTPTIEQLLSPPNTWVPLNPIFMNGYFWRLETDERGGDTTMTL